MVYTTKYTSKVISTYILCDLYSCSKCINQNFCKLIDMDGFYISLNLFMHRFILFSYDRGISIIFSFRLYVAIDNFPCYSLQRPKKHY